MAEGFSRDTAHMYLDPVDVDPDHNHVRIGETVGEHLVRAFRPQAAHLGPVFNQTGQTA